MIELGNYGIRVSITMGSAGLTQTESDKRNQIAAEENCSTQNVSVTSKILITQRKEYGQIIAKLRQYLDYKGIKLYDRSGWFIPKQEMKNVIRELELTEIRFQNFMNKMQTDWDKICHEDKLKLGKLGLHKRYPASPSNVFHLDIRVYDASCSIPRQPLIEFIKRELSDDQEKALKLLQRQEKEQTTQFVKAFTGKTQALLTGIIERMTTKTTKGASIIADIHEYANMLSENNFMNIPEINEIKENLIALATSTTVKEYNKSIDVRNKVLQSFKQMADTTENLQRKIDDMVF